MKPFTRLESSKTYGVSHLCSEAPHFLFYLHTVIVAIIIFICNSAHRDHHFYPNTAYIAIIIFIYNSSRRDHHFYPHTAHITIIITTSMIARNPKLNAENFLTYAPVPLGLWRVYSLNVMSDARDAISVPAPPILTPTRSSL